MFRLMALLFVIQLPCSSVRADLIVTIGNSDSNNRSSLLSVTAGDLVTLGLYIHNDIATPNTTLAPGTFTLAFDIAAPGADNFYDDNSPLFVSLFTDFTITPVAQGTGIITPPSDVVFSLTPTRGFDVVVDFTPEPAIGFLSQGTQASAVHIANISFRTNGNTISGTYGFKFNPNAAFPDNSAINSASNFVLAAGADGTSFNRFNVTAIPEPNSMMLGGLVSVAICWRVRRRKYIRNLEW